MTDGNVELSFVFHGLGVVWDLPDLCKDKITALKRFRRGSYTSLDQSGVKLGHTDSYSVSLPGLLDRFSEHLH